MIIRVSDTIAHSLKQQEPLDSPHAALEMKLF